MADFPQNLDDGELWLPSDIFPDEAPSKFRRPHYPSELASMEDLAHRFAALSFLDRHRSQTVAKTPNLEYFTPPVPYGLIESLPTEFKAFNGGFGVGGGHGLHGYGGGERLWTGSRPPVYPLQFRNPVQPQAESIMETRAVVLNRQRNRFSHNRVLQRRVLPLQASGLGLEGGGGPGGGGGGGFVRDYGGTGVFLPRVAAANTTPTTTTRITTTTAAVDGGRRRSLRNKQEIQGFAHRNQVPFKMFDVGKQEECHYQFPADMGLPKDWTY